VMNPDWKSIPTRMRVQFTADSVFLSNQDHCTTERPCSLNGTGHFRFWAVIAAHRVHRDS